MDGGGIVEPTGEDEDAPARRRRSRAATSRKARAGPSRGRALTALALLAVPTAVGAVYFGLLMGDGGRTELTASPIVDPHAMQSDPSSALMIAALPQEPEAMDALIAPPPDPAPAIVETERVVEPAPDPEVNRLLKAALARNEALAEDARRIGAELAETKGALKAISVELDLTKKAADQDARRHAMELRALKSRHAAELAAVRAAEGAAVVVEARPADDRSSEEERRRLAELRKIQERQFRSNGVVMDEAPAE